MNKEEVLQRANEYCNERSYDESTLTSDFKEKFADFFAKKYADGDINDEAVIADLKFNLDTAKSAASKGRATMQQDWESKENDYKSQIEALNKKIGRKTDPKPFEIPKDLQEQIDELRAFKTKAAKEAKFTDVITVAKKHIRTDLHKSFEKFAEGADVDVDKGAKEQADALVARFQEIFKDTIGDVKPLAPRVVRENDEAVMSSLPRIKV